MQGAWLAQGRGEGQGELGGDVVGQTLRPWSRHGFQGIIAAAFLGKISGCITALSCMHITMSRRCVWVRH